MMQYCKKIYIQFKDQNTFAKFVMKEDNIPYVYHIDELPRLVFVSKRNGNSSNLDYKTRWMYHLDDIDYVEMECT